MAPPILNKDYYYVLKQRMLRFNNRYKDRLMIKGDHRLTEDVFDTFYESWKTIAQEHANDLDVKDVPVNEVISEELFEQFLQGAKALSDSLSNLAYNLDLGEVYIEHDKEYRDYTYLSQEIFEICMLAAYTYTNFFQQCKYIRDYGIEPATGSRRAKEMAQVLYPDGWHTFETPLETRLLLDNPLMPAQFEVDKGVYRDENTYKLHTEPKNRKPYEKVKRENDKIRAQRIDNINKAIFGDDEGPTPQMNNAHDMATAFVQGQVARSQKEQREEILKQTDRARAPQLLDRDIKKSNDMMPYGIQVRLIAVNDKKEFVQYVDFIVGVKTILHPVGSDDMIENIARALQNKSLAFKLLKWTTGEISLVKDIIFNLNDIKADAINRSNGRSPFFSTLKRLKDKKISMRNFTVPHALIPNATIVITSYEADFLENKYGIKIRDEKVASKLIKSLFLMSFIIMDEGTNTISVLYDGDSMYQTYALETLERENSLNSNKFSSSTSSSKSVINGFEIFI